MKKVLITGVAGQDGRILSEFLYKKNYQIFGMVNGQSNVKYDAFKDQYPYVNLIRGDLTDISSLKKIIELAQPDEIYNLAAISHVGLSFNQPEMTANVTGLGVLRLLEAVKMCKLENHINFFQASSSEMFGKVHEVPQKESTLLHPRSPYGVAKVFAHHICINYREAYGMKINCGIMFNHESEYRGYEFVTRKITSNVAKIKLGIIDKFKLGNLEPKRDWGYARDYIDAMWKMNQLDQANTLVIATGKNYSVREFLEKALAAADLPIEIDKFVEIDKDLTRPSEVDHLIGDASQAKLILDWEPTTNLDKLVEIMVENDLRIEKSKK